VRKFIKTAALDLNFEMSIRNPFLANLYPISNGDLAKDNVVELRTVQMLSKCNLKNPDVPYLRLLREPWLLLFLLLQSTSASRGFQLLL